MLQRSAPGRAIVAAVMCLEALSARARSPHVLQKAAQTNPLRAVTTSRRLSRAQVVLAQGLCESTDAHLTHAALQRANDPSDGERAWLLMAWCSDGSMTGQFLRGPADAVQVR